MEISTALWAAVTHLYRYYYYCWNCYFYCSDTGNINVINTVMALNQRSNNSPWCHGTVVASFCGVLGRRFQTGCPTISEDPRSCSARFNRRSLDQTSQKAYQYETVTLCVIIIIIIIIIIINIIITFYTVWQQCDFVTFLRMNNNNNNNKQRR